ncbi:PD-(D/E)XK nuclease family protein, partial [Elstera cyanobacteriorum]|uniref:PD-(D/E)XK nuclease family protein n=2 Tax=Elstera cyanobacteriorum TaxID=2022747 RepID=UPI00166EB9D5
MSKATPIFYVTSLSHYTSLGACDSYLLHSALGQSSHSDDQRDDTGWASELGTETERMFQDLFSNNPVSLEEAAENAMPGFPGIAKQVELAGELDDLQGGRVFLKGAADFVVIERRADASLRYTVVEIKTAVNQREEFLLQVALYVHLLRNKLGDQAKVFAKVIRRNPATDKLDPDAFQQVPDIDDNILQIALQDARLIIKRFFEVYAENEDKKLPVIQFYPSCGFCNHARQCLDEAIRRNDWAVLGLTIGEQQALREVKVAAECDLEKSKHSEAVHLGLRRSLSEIQDLRSARSAVLRNGGLHQVRSYGYRRLPKIGKTRLLEIFIIAQNHPRSAYLKLAGFSWAAFNPGGEQESSGAPYLSILSRENEKHGLEAFISRLLATIDSFVADGEGRVYFYVWRHEEISALVDRCAHHSSGADELMSFASTLTERDQKGERRFTGMMEEIELHCTRGSIGNSLLTLGLLKWPNAPDADPAEEWLKLGDHLGDFISDAVGSINDTGSLRKAINELPWLPQSVPERVVRAMAEGTLEPALVANAWLGSLGFLKKAYQNIRDDIQDRDIEILKANIWRLPVSRSKNLAVNAALEYIKGANEQARRSWIARHSVSPARLVARGKGIIVHSLKWMPEPQKSRRMEVSLDPDFLPRSANGIPEAAFSALNLASKVRAVLFDEDDKDLPFDSWTPRKTPRVGVGDVIRCPHGQGGTVDEGSAWVFRSGGSLCAA